VDYDILIQTIAINALPVIFAITLHEAAHGWVAYRLGDRTAWTLGRVTLNPMPHIDFIGTIVMPVLLLFLSSGQILFGYAKPVPVSYGNLKNPRRDMVWVALAGPLMNFFQALLWSLAQLALIRAGVEERFFLEMCKGGILINAVLFAFNLFPLLPLDGGRVLAGLLPRKWAWQFAKIEPWGLYIMLALMFTNIISNFWIKPIMQLMAFLLSLLLIPFHFLLLN
jgi:Zn-dependent protease